MNINDYCWSLELHMKKNICSDVQPRRGCGTSVRCWPRVSPAVIDMEALRAFKPRLLRVTGISAGLARLIRHCIQPQRGFKACSQRNDPECSTPLGLQRYKRQRFIPLSDLSSINILFADCRYAINSLCTTLCNPSTEVSEYHNTSSE